jgi:hypothetical protein
MSAIDDLIPLLGAPPGADAGPVDALQRQWGVELPADFLAFAKAYGDLAIDEYLYVWGARYLESYAESMGRRMEGQSYVPAPVLPTEGGMLLWGNTVEGDQLFLVDRGEGRWTVSAFRRGQGDWYDSDLAFVPWLRGVLTEEVAAEWFPEWDDTIEVCQLAR